MLNDHHPRRRIEFPADADSRLDDYMAVALTDFETLNRLLAAVAAHHEPVSDWERFPDSDYGHPANMT